MASKRKPTRAPRKTAPDIDPLDLDAAESGSDDEDEPEEDDDEPEEVEAEVVAEPEEEDPDPHPYKTPPKPAKAARVAPAASGKMLVRIRPFNKRRGQITRSYTYKGHRLREGMGWYIVPADVARYLKTVRCSDLDPLSPEAFDVCTVEEAKQIDEAETETRSPQQAKASAPRRAR